MRRFTNSKDGIARTDLRVTLRVDAEGLAQLEAKAKRREQTLSEFLYWCLKEGVWRDEDEDQNWEED